MRVAAWLCLLTLALSVCLTLLAVRAYPGGSWERSDAPGFRLWTNYWCDLMRADAVNGASNARAALWAKTAFAALAVSLAAYWPVAASFGSSGTRAHGWSRLGVVSGWASAACVVLVAALPYDTLRRSHSVSTLAGGALGLLATLLVLAASLRAGPIVRWRHLYGLLLVAAALVHIAVYADIVLTKRVDSAALPIVQRVATGLLLAWMLATLWEARAATSATPPRSETHPGRAADV